MSLKYLNLSGLEDLWINIKNYILSKIPTKTSELTNDSGYLTSHQSLANYVTLNGTQTISGIKTISTNLKFSTTNTRGKAPSANEERDLIDYRDSAGNRISLFETMYNKDKSSKTSIYAYKTTAATGGNIGSMGIGCDASGNVYTFAPTPASLDNSTKIATTAFVKAQGYLTSHQSLANYVTTDTDQSISGSKIFNDDKIVITQGNGYRMVCNTDGGASGYGVFQRVDGSSWYLMVTAQNDALGSWTSARPASMNLSTGVLSINGNAATATKLATARSIALGNELAGSANFDGSGNITVNANAYLSVVGVGNKNNYPYHRFAYFGPVTNAYQDAAIRLQVARQCINGGSGILEIEFRTNAKNRDGECDVRWIVRSSKLPVDCIQIGFFKTWGGIYADVFCKSSGAYDSYVIRSMGDGSRGSYERKFTLQDCSEANNTTTSDPLTSVNSYASIAAAGTALHKKAYTDILTATDAGVVETANTCSGNSATATQFSANTTVALTGDATGTSAGSKKGWSVPVTLANSGVTAGTYGPTADVTGNNNATISVPQITVDAKGRVTSVTNRTLTCKNNTYNVYNKTLTIQKNGTNVATFTSNSNTDVTANITVPTKVSELTNDSGYLTSHQSLANYLTKTTNVSEMGRYIDLHYDNATSKYDYDARLYVDSQGTAAGGGSFKIAAASAYAPAPASNANDTRIATTAWVNSKGYLTSHQSLSNYVTLNGAQSISGNKTFSSINGVEPSSLSLPDLKNRIDISSYITNLSNVSNEYTPSVNGWISIRSANATKISVSDNASNIGNTSVSNTATYLTVTNPVVANRKVNILIKCTSLSHAYFIPCQGNV